MDIYIYRYKPCRFGISFKYSGWRVYVTRVHVTISPLRYDFGELLENCQLKTLLNSEIPIHVMIFSMSSVTYTRQALYA